MATKKISRKQRLPVIATPAATSVAKFGKSSGGSKKSATWKGPLPEPSASILGAKPGTLAESQSWKHLPDPLDIYLTNGKHAVRIGNTWFTKVRADKKGGGKQCYWTLTFWITTYGWYRASGGPCFLELLNAQGGVLAHYDLDVPLDCRHQGKQDPRFHTSAFDPDIYDLIRRSRFTVPASTWYRCKS